ncbi:MAG: histidine kinase dimerization/phospho-acceptor domain-containing protein [Trueperaceae bacterium]|nr:histidine kinase dimerization/phospho-acceptor domain-containing protein [Trueperaceae bacterium]
MRDHRIERVWHDQARAELKVGGRHLLVVPIPAGLALRDVSEARQAEIDAREMLAVVSHELRTPVTTITSTLEALEYDDLPAAERAQLLERAHGEAQRLVRLLNDLTVDVAPPRERSVPVREVVARACAVLAPTFEQHGVTVHQDVADLVVWADPDKVLQVLVNLLENAAVHGPDHADVRVAVVAKDGQAYLAVRDEGEPLSAERLEALLDPHARDASRTGWRGLGLYVVRSIVDAAGGTAWARAWRDDASGQGNEFGATFPLSGRPPAQAQS